MPKESPHPNLYRLSVFTRLVSKAMNKIFLFLFSILVYQPIWAESLVEGETLKTVRDRGLLNCGVGSNDTGFSTQTTDGEWVGFDVDFCRAIAVAVLNNSQAVEFVPLDSLTRFEALQSGYVDVLIRTTTWTYERDTNMGLDFVGISLFDSQSILVQSQSQIQSKEDLVGRTICTNEGTTSAVNLSKFLMRENINAETLILSTQEGRWRAFLNQECDAVTADRSDLQAKIATLSTEDYAFLPDIIAAEPLGPVVRDADRQWFDIVKWSLFALVKAEDEGITKNNMGTLPSDIKNLPSAQLGLRDDWAMKMIGAIGNYGEVFERNLGSGSVLKLDRGQNNLVKNGGLQYAMPFQ